ncbi:putative ATP-dependent RNA helicase DHR2 [Wickerhamiella sorbophila]|uniref:RNA helicase n=1 Tax=Wickerhamiella sorbophila TaxID=45607 RepID=A0A2T0FCG7_9ASCO|nr:putative ATP-dependent RNA helicase DHR2 [Wickerhamiella sorbophila]PRT52629.1 putative ATP-dependent RNA helicase DHR2 [Wickerhamiella sorbophila]
MAQIGISPRPTKLGNAPDGFVMKTVDFSDSEDSDALPKQRSSVAYEEILRQRRRLPMYKGRKAVTEAVLASQVTVIIGETGSGKSTQLPQLLLDVDPKQRIAVTQPRRVAAMSLATRVAAEMQTGLGERVGYQVRFQAKLGLQTVLRYVTDGMLLREIMIDPNLRRYTTIIIDEAHERTVTTDLLLGLLKQILANRPQLRVVVMSATLDAETFSEFFGGARILYVEGKTYPVERFYLKAEESNLVEATVKAVEQVNSTQPTGDVLVFLSGQDEIEATAEQLHSRAPNRPNNVPKIWAVPLYAALPERAQQKAFAETPARTRKVVLATNIAETSLTIPGIRYVIDGGRRKVRVYRSKLGLDSLLPVSISQASAAQRMGRAGREAPGKCFRLYLESDYMKMAPHTEPEIALCPVSGPVLTLKNAGVDNVYEFPWIQTPNQRSVANALLQLYALGALDSAGKITKFGSKMSVLPVDPALAAVLVHAVDQEVHVRDAVIDIAACLNVPDLLLTPPVAKQGEVAEARAELFPAAAQYGDLILVKQIYDAYESLVASGAGRRDVRDWCARIAVSPRAMQSVNQIRAQLRRYLRLTRERDQADEDTIDYELIIKSFLRGYPTNTAVGLADRRYQSTVNNQPINIHPSSSLFGRRSAAIMYLEYVFTTKAYARVVSPVELDWLREVAPNLLGSK